MLKPQANFIRQIQTLEGFWKFRRDPNNSGEDDGWHNTFDGEFNLAVPGNWNEQISELEQYFGIGWYRVEFQVPANGPVGSVLAHFGAVQNHAKVWLNGSFVGSHEGGLLPFTCDLTDSHVKGAKNTLIVKVDASINPWDLPPAKIDTSVTNEGFHNSNPAVTYDFFPYGGIPRPVVIQITPSHTFLESVRVDTEIFREEQRALVQVTATTNQHSPATLEVTIAGATQSAAIDLDGKAQLSFQIDDPQYWDLGKPHLYEANLVLKEGPEIIDNYTQTFGLRTVEVTSDALLVNGKPVFLRGFGKHEDFPVLGRGLSLPLIIRDFDLLNWIGANSFRTSHYPYAEEWYDFADRNGILIIGETPLVGLCERIFAEPNLLRRSKQLVRDMIDRDHHHPSVIMWSVANEPWIESEEGADFIRELLAEARAADQSRPVTYVAHNDTSVNAPCHDCDVVSVNRYGGWYDFPGDIPTGTKYLEEVLSKYRKTFGKPVLLSEFGADAIPGQHALPATMFTEEFQADIIEAQILAAEAHEGVIGTHVWAFSDFKTGQSITRAVRNHKGVFTRERTPKMAAHRIRKLWQETDQ